ncbi:hypothetical protein [Gordonia terrae]
MFLELYSASVITIMFVTSIVVWVRDERGRRRPRHSPTHTVTMHTATPRDPHEVHRQLERRKAQYAAANRQVRL